MRVLALDTATRATTVAFWDGTDGGQIEARDDPPAGARPGHARVLLPLVEEVLTRGGAGWEHIDRIAVGIGPGTFTGLRIGVATAQALARARGIELVGISTLQALALAARNADRERPVLAVIDARRGEAFAAAWAAGADPAVDPPLLEPSVLAPDRLVAVAGTTAAGALAVGDGALVFRPLLERAGITVPDSGSELSRVSARAHCRLAPGATVGPPDAVQPSYLRRPDAEIAREGRRNR